MKPAAYEAPTLQVLRLTAEHALLTGSPIISDDGTTITYPTPSGSFDGDEDIATKGNAWDNIWE